MSGIRTRALPRRGGGVSVVRWVLTEDGWQHELRSGQYLGHGRDGFRIVIDGVEQRLPDDVWAVCKR